MAAPKEKSCTASDSWMPDAEKVIQKVSIKLYRITIIEKSNLIQIFGNIVVMVSQKGKLKKR